jgi:hypothetical protein
VFNDPKTPIGSTFIHKLNSEPAIDFSNMRQGMDAVGVTIDLELTHLTGSLKLANLLLKIYAIFRDWLHLTG